MRLKQLQNKRMPLSDIIVEADIGLFGCLIDNSFIKTEMFQIQ